MNRLDELYSELARRDQEYRILERLLKRIKEERDTLYDELLEEEAKKRRGILDNG